MPSKNMVPGFWNGKPANLVPVQWLSEMSDEMVRLAAAKDAEIAALKDEIENLQADAGNDGSYIAAMRSGQAQICEAIGVERGHDHWPEFMERVKHRIATLTRAAGPSDEGGRGGARMG